MTRHYAPLTQSPAGRVALLLLAALGCERANTPGKTGPVGLPALIQVEAREPDAECPSGGLEVMAGVDEDKDGLLSDWEILTRSALCNGEAGAVGLRGEGGAPCEAIRDEAAGETTILCAGETPVTVRDGEDGAPCEVHRDEAAGETLITCPDAPPVALRDGARGADGAPCEVRQGAAGEALITCPGQAPVAIHDGADGADGAPCEVYRDEVAGETVIACPGGEATRLPDARGGDTAGRVTVEMRIGEGLDLSTGLVVEEGADFTLEEERGALSARPTWETPLTLAHLRGHLGLVGVEDLAQVEAFEGRALALEPESEEAGPLVTLLRTPHRVYALGEVRRLDEERCALTYRVLLEALPQITLSLDEPYDLEALSVGYSQTEVGFSLIEGERGGLQLLPMYEVHAGRLEGAPFEHLRAEALGRVEMRRFDPTPISLKGEGDEPVVALLRVPSRQTYKLGGWMRLSRREIGFSLEPLFERPHGALLSYSAREPFRLEPGLNVDGAFFGVSDAEPGVALDPGWGLETARLSGIDYARVRPEDAAAARFEAHTMQPLAPGGFERGPIVVLMRDPDGRVYKLGNAAPASTHEVLFDVAPLIRELPPTALEIGAWFDLEGGRAPDDDLDAADFALEWAGGEPSTQARLVPARGVEVARLAPALYAQVTAADAEGLEFTDAPTLMALEEELWGWPEHGPLVLLVRTAHGRLFKLDPGRALGRWVWGFDYAPLD